MWFGIVYRRWSGPGVLAFIAAQIIAGLAVGLLISKTHIWPGFGLTGMPAAGLTGLLAALAALLFAGGYATIRRVTV
jgi:hypothetical protein